MVVVAGAVAREPGRRSKCSGCPCKKQQVRNVFDEKWMSFSPRSTVENRGYSQSTVVEKTTFTVVHHDSEASHHLHSVQTETYFVFVVIVALTH